MFHPQSPNSAISAISYAAIPSTTWPLHKQKHVEWYMTHSATGAVADATVGAVAGAAGAAGAAVAAGNAHWWCCC